MPSEPRRSTYRLLRHHSDMLSVFRQIKSSARLRMTFRASRSKPQMLSKPRSSVAANAEPLEVSPHITNLELAPVFCWKNINVRCESQSLSCRERTGRTRLCFCRVSTGLAENGHSRLLVRMINTSAALPLSVAHVTGSVQSVLPLGTFERWQWEN